MTEKRKTRTSSAVKNRYNSRVYGSIIVRVPKEMAEAFKQKCAETGIPQAQIVKRAIEEFLKAGSQQDFDAIQDEASRAPHTEQGSKTSGEKPTE